MFPELLRKHLSGIVDLPDAQVGALAAHYELMLRWNNVLNLTAVRTVEEAVVRHYCEAVFLAVHLPVGALRVADIGSGAGFPGIAVAVLRPDCACALIESHQRKAVFLREATRGLSNVEVLGCRADEVTEHFDHAVSRAVSYEDLVPYLKHLGEYADLLTGSEGPPAALGFSWDYLVRLPWGDRRFLRMGHRVTEKEADGDA